MKPSSTSTSSLTRITAFPPLAATPALTAAPKPRLRSSSITRTAANRSTHAAGGAVPGGVVDDDDLLGRQLLDEPFQGAEHAPPDRHVTMTTSALTLARRSSCQQLLVDVAQATRRGGQREALEAFGSGPGGNREPPRGGPRRGLGRARPSRPARSSPRRAPRPRGSPRSCWRGSGRARPSPRPGPSRTAPPSGARAGSRARGRTRGRRRLGISEYGIEARNSTLSPRPRSSVNARRRRPSGPSPTISARTSRRPSRRSSASARSRSWWPFSHTSRAAESTRCEPSPGGRASRAAANRSRSIPGGHTRTRCSGAPSNKRASRARSVQARKRSPAARTAAAYGLVRMLRQARSSGRVSQAVTTRRKPSRCFRRAAWALYQLPSSATWTMSAPRSSRSRSRKRSPAAFAPARASGPVGSMSLSVRAGRSRSSSSSVPYRLRRGTSTLTS